MVRCLSAKRISLRAALLPSEAFTLHRTGFSQGPCCRWDAHTLLREFLSGPLTPPEMAIPQCKCASQRCSGHLRHPHSMERDPLGAALGICHSMECFYFRAALDVWDVHSMERISLRASLDIWDIHSMKRVSLRAVLAFWDELCSSLNKLASTLLWASLVTQLVKNLPAMWETWVRCLGWEDPLKKGKDSYLH